MKPNQYLECLELIAKRDNLSLSEFHPVQPSEIMAVERELETELPQEYEEFLIIAGCGKEFGGIAWWYHFDLSIPGNIIDVSQKLAENQKTKLKKLGLKETKFPKQFVPIYDDCEGKIYGFCLNGHNKFNSQVYAWDTETLEKEKISETLNEFLDFLLEDENINIEDLTGKQNG